MKTINILTIDNFFHDHCSYCFIYPILKNQKTFLENGIKFKLFQRLNDDFENCDIAIVDSRFYGNLKQDEKKKFLEKIGLIQNKTNKIIFADTADNAGQIKSEILPIFSEYWKGQILKDLEKYLEPHYGGRYFTNYYHKKFKIYDNDHQYSTPVKNKKLLKKIKISWNMGLVNYGNLSHILQKIFSFIPSKFLLFDSVKLVKPQVERSNDFSCRIGFDYYRKTISFQRRKIVSMLENKINFSKISRKKYLNELSISKFSISPFGWGELCPRDFETFTKGAILIKPNMSSFCTWPDWYIKDKTYIPIKWDLTDIIKIMENSFNNYALSKTIAVNAQEKYKKYILGKHASELFVKHFVQLI